MTELIIVFCLFAISIAYIIKLGLASFRGQSCSKNCNCKLKSRIKNTAKNI